MKPISFPEATRLSQPSGRLYSDNVIGVEPLPMWTDGEQCVSLWRLSLWERLSLLIRGTIWVQVLSGPTQPPIAFWPHKKFFLCESNNFEASRRLVTNLGDGSEA